MDQIGLAVTRQAQSNDLAISDGVRKMIDEIRPSLPPGVTLEIGSDNSVFTSHAIDEVWITIGISMALVALVNFIFLGSLRAALINRPRQELYDYWREFRNLPSFMENVKAKVAAN